MDVEDQIPPTLPLQKGGIPLFGKEGVGKILQQYVFSIMDSLVFEKLVEIPGGSGFEEKIIEFMGPTQAT